MQPQNAFRPLTNLPVHPTPSPAEWTARWIAPSNVAQRTNVYFRSRRNFTIAEVPLTAIVHLAAETSYRFWVNGILAGRGPVRGTSMVNFFDTFDIASLLVPGENWLAAEVYSPNRDTFKAAPAEPAVLLQADFADLATGDSWQVQEAPEWRQDVPMFTFQIGHMEWRNLALSPDGWQTGTDVSSWHSPAVLSINEQLAGKQLLPRDIPPLAETAHLPVRIPFTAAVPALQNLAATDVAELMTTEPHTPVDCGSTLPLCQSYGTPLEIAPLPDGQGVSLVMDFGREINGRLEIDIEAPEGTTVDLGYEEDIKNDRLQLTHFSYRFADRNILRAGLQTIGDAYTERGFKTAQIVLRNFNGPVRIHQIRGIDRVYPYTERGAFTCSDPLLNQIWAACVETLRACTTDTYVDCPWRENAFYFNDMLVENLTSLQAFGDPRIGRRCFRLAASQARPDGLWPAPVPVPRKNIPEQMSSSKIQAEGEWPDEEPVAVEPELSETASYDRMVLTAGNLFLPGMLETHLLYTGDEELVRELIGKLQPMLDTFASWEDEAGLLHPAPQHWNFIDWSYPESLDGRNTASLNWLHVLALDATARLWHRLGEPKKATVLETKAARLAESIDEHFWDEGRACYLEYHPNPGEEPLASQFSHAVALLSNRLPATRQEAALNALTREDLLAPELYLHCKVLRAMEQFGLEAAALERVRRHWGPIILSGSTTIWESGIHSFGKAAFAGAGSLCHGFSTTAADFLQGVILGVRPLTPGFEQCSIAPRPLDLEHASGIVPTPQGDIEITWRRDKDTLHVDLRLPIGVSAKLPDGQRVDAGKHYFRFDV